MRPIKFRAWDKENKEMAYSPDILFGKNGLPETLRHEDWCGDCEPENYTSEIDGYHDAEKFVLTQFTGLHDKNGNEIWEGDILGRVYEWSPQIQYLNEVTFTNGQFGLKPNSHSMERIENGLIFIQQHVVEVLGNIYANPELLKAKP